MGPFGSAVRINHAQEHAIVKMSAFTRDEIAYFREQYANQLRPNARGVDQDGFVRAISASVLHAELASQGVEQLIVSFNKIKSSDGVLAWPQFFQVNFPYTIILFLSLVWSVSKCLV